ncbi:hypothetical protein [Dyadobacter sandarakinus]|uniref:Uncharacterized protein n=1 Tax=Dyadobacter sandarakinus TaxID=2747268 RepID=A0ABX7I940_9BACT|nr:hypothetical protein [Dyadobacter sandarakinus]QRR02626.1 hypothetical protein HWI92_17755 [Dyadobacter sandarakinus]
MNQGEKYQAIARFQDSYPDFAQFRELIQNAEVHEEKNATYLVLRPATDITSMKVGEEYQYHKEQKLVLVPLHIDNQ